MIIYKKAKKGDFTLTSSFLTYLYAVCRRLWLKKLGEKSRSVTDLNDTMDFTDTADIDELIIKRDQYKLYREKFNRLGADCKEVLGLFFTGKSMKVIAETMGYKSEEYAKKRKFKCKEQLIEAIKKDSVYAELTNSMQ